MRPECPDVRTVRGRTLQVEHPRSPARGVTMSKSSSAHIVVAVDGTAGSAGALRYAVQEAGLRGVGLRLVHVSPGYGPLAPMEVSLDPKIFAEAGREVVEAAEKDVHDIAPDVFVERHLAQGPRV